MMHAVLSRRAGFSGMGGAARGPSPRAVSMSAERIIPDFRGRHVMVVASAPTVRLIEAMLAPTGARVTGISEGREAVQAQRREPADLILMGIRLRGMDGFEATRQIRRTDSEVPILAITRVEPADPPAFAAAGIDDYIDKPLDLNEVYASLTRFLQGGRTG